MAISSTGKCDSSSISNCATAIAAVDCLEIIYQGENKDLEILLSDASGNLINTNEIIELYIKIFDDTDIVIATFSYPQATGDEDIIFMQTTEGVQFVNKGKIMLQITSDMSEDMLPGSLYTTIKVLLPDATATGKVRTVIIGCLQIAKVRSSKF